MAGLVPAIHAFFCRSAQRKTWMPGTRPGMTWKLRSQPRNDLRSLLRLAGILHRPEGREFDVVEFAVDLLDLADVDVLHDVAGLGINRDRAARALPLHPLHGRD